MMGTRLVHDVSWPSIASYLGYFALVWWLWASHTFYADRYDTDDLIRELSFVLTFTIGVVVSTNDSRQTGSACPS